MSRTDKDAPWWTRSPWWTPTHIGCDDRSAIGRRGARPCDLPPRPLVANHRQWPGASCQWHPQWEGRRHRAPAPPRWYINHVWTARQRLAVRIQCAQAAAEHRAGGDVETIPSTQPTRHSARWLWD